jgi:hypothetical protein
MHLATFSHKGRRQHGEADFPLSEELEVPLNNIRAGAKLLKEITQRLPKGTSIAEIATLYNDLGAKRVSDYGARAERVYIYRLWQ